VHEVTSPQAFDGLRLAGRSVRRPDLTLATEDHNTPTDNLVTIPKNVLESQILLLSSEKIEALDAALQFSLGLAADSRNPG